MIQIISNFYYSKNNKSTKRHFLSINCILYLCWIRMGENVFFPFFLPIGRGSFLSRFLPIGLQERREFQFHQLFSFCFGVRPVNSRICLQISVAFSSRINIYKQVIVLFCLCRFQQNRQTTNYSRSYLFSPLIYRTILHSPMNVAFPKFLIYRDRYQMELFAVIRSKVI